jgi:glycosyltransferase involved in cell wall biosynthesis
MRANGKYTIILPVHNGGHYVKQCVQSILAQTIPDFDLVVLENGSTDGTVEWLSTLRDPRVRIVASPVALSIEDNWSRALETPKNEFMTFIGHDDLLDPNYLEVMAALIDREPQASLYFAHFRYIDKDDQLIRHCRPLPARETAAEYIAALFSEQRDTHGGGYMMRSALYHEVGGIPKHKKLLFADDALWITLMHRSWKATAAEECFCCRRHDASAGALARYEWIEGMCPYITLLEQLSSRDPAVALAYATYAPPYFYGSCHTVYMQEITRATENNRRFPWHLQKEIFTQLARVSPELSRDMKRVTRKVRLYNLINGTALTRWLYKWYLFLRRGRRLPSHS